MLFCSQRRPASQIIIIFLAIYTYTIITFAAPPTILNVFGQRNRKEAAAGAVTGNNIYHASGVIVDRSLTPNAIYVFDTGDNRILGFRSYASKKADLIFGQPDEFSNAANGDCNVGMYGNPATPTSFSLFMTRAIISHSVSVRITDLPPTHARVGF